MPIPSKRYRELVCTVGVTRNGKLIRLYPIPYRYLDFSKWYKKYQWIKVDIEKNKNDNRIDSYRPNIKTISVIGNPLPTGKWKERKRIVLPLVSASLEEIEEKFEKKKVSLGIFKPKNIKLKIEKDNEGWSTGKQRTLRQLVLFGKQPKKLEKLPFKFSYQFICDNKNCKGHKLKIVDWELSELYRKLKDKNPYSIDIILKGIRQKWEEDMWEKKRDSYLIVGTHHPYKSFLALGVFWPPM